MDIQTLFYILGITAMLMWIIFLLGVVILLIVVRKRIQAVQQEVEERLGIVNSIFSKQNLMMASKFSALLPVITLIGKMIKNRSKEKEN